jgi:DNA transposition AAA+ family ATPase
METAQQQDVAPHIRRGDWINVTRAEVLAGVAGYSEQDQADLIWLHGYGSQELAGSRSRLVEQVGVTWPTVWKIWNGSYGASIEETMKKVRSLRKRVESMVRKRFIETIVTKRIWAVADVALERSVMVMISGSTGRSKSWSLNEWCAARNHGRAVPVYCPRKGGYGAFLKKLAAALRICTQGSEAGIREAITKSLDARNVLVLDEVAHLYPVGKRSSIDSLEWIRELHDTTGCGVILCATDGLEGMLRSGPYAQWFDQLMGRIELHLRIPRQFSRQEIADLLTGYLDDPDPSLVTAARQIANSSTRGCRDLFRHLDRAARVAAEIGKPLTAELLTQTVAAAAKMLTIETE